MRFNTLYRGSASDAAAELDGGDHTQRATNEELQAALVNALQRIAALEKNSHAPVEGLCKADDVERELSRLEARIDALRAVRG